MSEGTLNLRLLDPGKRGASYDVVARVQAVGRDSSDIVPRELVVPAQQADGTNVELASGIYTVRLYLPNGRVLQQICEIVDGGKSSLVFNVPASSDGSFSLQESIGSASLSELLDSAVTARGAVVDTVASDRGRTAGANVKRPDRKNLRGPSSGIERTRQPRGMRGGGSLLAGTPRAVTSPPQARAHAGAAPGATATLELSASGAFTGEAAWALLASMPSEWSQSTQWTSMAAGAAKETASIWRIASPPSDDSARSWAFARTAKAMELISLPIPWRCVEGGNLSPVDVLVDATVGGRAASAVAVHDAALDGLLSYLDRGRLTALRPMMADLGGGGLITTMIYEKMVNPLAACAAGYVGLAVFDGSGREQWDDWLANIMRRFYWLPDGGILHARRIMLRPRSPGERAEVIPALKKAISAGIPYYSTGLQLLREMLEVLVEEEPEAKALLSLVQPIVARSDPRQLFTILRYPGAAT